VTPTQPPLGEWKYRHLIMRPLCEWKYRHLIMRPLGEWKYRHLIMRPPSGGVGVSPKKLKSFSKKE